MHAYTPPRWHVTFSSDYPYQRFTSTCNNSCGEDNHRSYSMSRPVSIELSSVCDTSATKDQDAGISRPAAAYSRSSRALTSGAVCHFRIFPSWWMTWRFASRNDFPTTEVSTTKLPRVMSSRSAMNNIELTIFTAVKPDISKLRVSDCQDTIITPMKANRPRTSRNAHCAGRVFRFNWRHCGLAQHCGESENGLRTNMVGSICYAVCSNADGRCRYIDNSVNCRRIG